MANREINEEVNKILDELEALNDAGLLGPVGHFPLFPPENSLAYTHILLDIPPPILPSPNYYARDFSEDEWAPFYSPSPPSEGEENEQDREAPPDQPDEPWESLQEDPSNDLELRIDD